jgi:membrane fusion protein, protease secretion system
MIRNPFAWFMHWVDRGLDHFSRWAKSFNPYVPEELSRDGIEPVKIEEDGIKRQAGKVVFVVFVIFLIWAVWAPLDQGVVVSGTVVVQGSRKAVQHPKGGVIQSILVKEGDQVEQGQVVIKLNPLNIEAELRQAEYEYINASATYSRLLAERTDSNVITWEAELKEFTNDPQLLEATRLQSAIFKSRRLEINDQRAILAKQAQGLRQQIVEKQKILALRQSQLTHVVEDAQNLRRLSSDGFVPRNRANESERSASEAQAAIISLQSDIANLQTSLSSNELELSKLMSSFYRDVDTQLSEFQKQKETLRSRVMSLRFDKSLVELRAPVSGIVVGLSVFTEGGVISGGEVLMEVVPEDRSLIAEVSVPPHLIDKVRVGMQTDMRFSAFNMITTPVVPGVVRLVGADRLPPRPPQFPEEYFLAQVAATDEAFVLLGNQVVVPGMPVEVVIKSGERTFMNYILKPLADRFARAFKE